jgi:hypothetical protein
MDRPEAVQIKSADRRWVLLGMALGTLLGLAVNMLPEPARYYVIWISLGAIVGLIAPSVMLFHALLHTSVRFWWWLSGIGCLCGIVIGVVAAALGTRLPEEFPGESLAITATVGFFGGFAVAECCLRLIDARKRADYDKVSRDSTADNIDAP